MKILPNPKSVDITDQLKDFKAHVRTFNTLADFVREYPQFDRVTVGRIMKAQRKMTVSFKTAQDVKALVESLKATA